jgi:hypothetical protein
MTDTGSPVLPSRRYLMLGPSISPFCPAKPGTSRGAPAARPFASPSRGPATNRTMWIPQATSAMADADAQVTVEHHRALTAERQGPLPAAPSARPDGALRRPAAGSGRCRGGPRDSCRRRWSAAAVGRPRARPGRAARDDGWLHLGHGVGRDLVFFLKPPVQDPQPPVTGGDGLRRPAPEQRAEGGAVHGCTMAQGCVLHALCGRPAGPRTRR